MGDYVYTLTDQGRSERGPPGACSYIGPAPVPLAEYIVSVEAQTIRAEAPAAAQLEKAFADISVEPHVLERLGPAVNSGAGMFLYGAPGNGKIDARQAHHHVLRPAHLDSAGDDRGRPDHQAVRRGLPRADRQRPEAAF